jgi:glycosyltransferase involved in cell wall biosynthesis
MYKKKISIWFWIEMLSPHIGALAAALAKRGFKVFYVANHGLFKERSQQGWETTNLDKVKLILASSKDDLIRLSLKVPENSIHFSQGLRGNGQIKIAQNILRKRGLKHWVIMETVDDTLWHGIIKRIIYRLLFFRWRNHLAGVLAIGQNTLSWIIARGMEKSRVYSFAYFLKGPKNYYLSKTFKKKNTPFRFVYVGNLIKRKKIDHLIYAVAALKFEKVELWILGQGPEEQYLRSLADFLIPKKVKWFGVVPMSKISNIIRQSDCLVLPSRFDGWGAVVSESLMVGTPAVCSDTCGSSVIVKASGVGGVYSFNNKKAFVNILRKQYNQGKLDLKKRQKIAQWARCLGASAGAEYLDLIITNPKQAIKNIPWNIKSKIV